MFTYHIVSLHPASEHAHDTMSVILRSEALKPPFPDAVTSPVMKTLCIVEQ